jgi:hypothetical protein
MALNFPPTPTIGQVFPASPAAGVPQFKWDGSAWSSTMTGAVRYEVAQTIPSAQQIQACTNINAASSGALNDVGRNLLHNPLFNIAQRGAGPFTSALYTLDRWYLNLGTDTTSITQVALTDADRAGIGDEEAFRGLQNVFTGAANGQSYVEQRIEAVKRLSNKTIIVSFYAKGSAALKLGLNAYQSFGSGGSPSTGGFALTTGAVVNIGTAWARYSVTIPMPSIAGKTLGTNLDDSTWVRFYYSHGAVGTDGGSIGAQSGTVTLWGIQVEIAQSGQTQPTPLEKPDPQQDLAKCQRFYCAGMCGVAIGYAVSGQFSGSLTSFPVAMRGIPSVVYSGTLGTDSNVSAMGGPDSIFTYGFRAFATASATGSMQAMRTFTASADL